MTGHVLRVRIDHDRAILSVECHEPEDAGCRWSCTRGCEVGCDHPRVRRGSCNAAEWVGADGTAECHRYSEGECSIYDGMPVYVSWDIDHWEWSVKP